MGSLVQEIVECPSLFPVSICGRHADMREKTVVKGRPDTAVPQVFLDSEKVWLCIENSVLDTTRMPRSLRSPLNYEAVRLLA